MLPTAHLSGVHFWASNSVNHALEVSAFIRTWTSTETRLIKRYIVRPTRSGLDSANGAAGRLVLGYESSDAGSGTQ